MATDVASELLRVVEAASASLCQIGDPEASFRHDSGKWSKKELLGHLLDSAVNNHHRFDRAQQVEELTFPKYEQEHWVSVQGYAKRSWPELIELWRLYNRHLAHVISLIPEEKLAVTCVIGPYEPVSLGYLVEDYLVHLRHHLQQIGWPGAPHGVEERG
ncbi:MAG TPA: DinB family protein [Pyrinomonadaceae bacterium]|nr:DinB family protein [Pyrinomonadaceae bacterium]